MDSIGSRRSTPRTTRTAIVHYREVYAPYALQFVRGLLPRHTLEGRSIDQATDYNRNPLGTGPYRAGRVEDRRAHPARARARLLAAAIASRQIAKLLFKFLPNTNTRINQLKSGEVHVVALVPWDKHRELEARARR